MRRVVVVGAGISGLVVAYRLKDQAEVLLLEAEDRAGGKVLTRQEDGHLLELGPSSLMRGKPELETLIRDLGLAGEVLEAHEAAKRRFILHRGRLCEVPMGPGAFIKTPLLSPLAKLRIFTEPLRRKGSGEESVRSFFARRLGPQVADRLVDPFVSGVYAGDPDRLSMAAAFPLLSRWEQEHGSLLAGALAARKAAQAKARTREVPQAADGGDHPKRGIYSFRKGLSTLTDRLAELLGECVRSGCAVDAVTRLDDNRWRVSYVRKAGHPHAGYAGHPHPGAAGAQETLDADGLVLAIPAPAAARLLAPLAQPAAEALQEMNYAPVALRCLSYPAQALAGRVGFGFLVPGAEREKVLGALWNSSSFEGRAPADRFLVTAFLGGAREPGLTRLTDGEQSVIVREFLARTMTAPERPAQEWSHTWPTAIPQYEPGHTYRMERAQYAPRTMPGLYLVGAHLGGVSVPDCVATAEREAGRCRGYLASLREAPAV